MNDRYVIDELRRRAEQLAVPPSPPSRENPIAAVGFTWDDTGYAIEASYVRETVSDVTIVVVPGAEPPLIGAATVRSVAVPVIDLRPLLDLPGTARPVPRLIVLEETGRPSVALAADEFQRLLTLSMSELHVPTVGPDILRAETSVGTRLLDGDALLDLPPFFSASEGPHR